MVIKGSEVPEQNGRKPYPLAGHQITVQHFVLWVTTPENPFRPHKHERPEFWYIIDGQALVSLDGHEQAVEAGDLIMVAPWVEHRLRTDSRVRWICLG